MSTNKEEAIKICGPTHHHGCACHEAKHEAERAKWEQWRKEYDAMMESGVLSSAGCGHCSTVLYTFKGKAPWTLAQYVECNAAVVEHDKTCAKHPLRIECDELKVRLKDCEFNNSGFSKLIDQLNELRTQDFVEMRAIRKERDELKETLERVRKLLEGKLLEALGDPSDRLTAGKTAFILGRDGSKITGYVVTDKNGGAGIVNCSAVRWLDKKGMWDLMQRGDVMRAELEASEKERQRLFDLVRYQRAELHEAGLISDDEYFALASSPQSKECVARLEGYDAMKAQLESVKKQLAAAQRDIGALVNGERENKIKNLQELVDEKSCECLGLHGEIDKLKAAVAAREKATEKYRQETLRWADAEKVTKARHEQEEREWAARLAACEKGGAELKAALRFNEAAYLNGTNESKAVYELAMSSACGCDYVKRGEAAGNGQLTMDNE